MSWEEMYTCSAFLIGREIRLAGQQISPVSSVSFSKPQKNKKCKKIQKERQKM